MKEDDVNDVNEPKESSNKLVKKQSINVCSLFKYPSIRYRFLILNVVWVATKASFNGMAIASKSLSGNFYLNIIILFIIEAIGYYVTGNLTDIKKLGRRGTLWIEYGLIIVVFILLAFIHLNTAGSLILYCIARFCCAGFDIIYYTYTLELYPTPIRSLAFGINIGFGSAGSISAPYLLEFLKNWQFLIFLDALCVISAIGLIFLPETVGKPMVESIKELDMENNNENNIEGNKEEIKNEDNVNKKDKIPEKNILSINNRNNNEIKKE